MSSPVELNTSDARNISDVQYNNRACCHFRPSLIPRHSCIHHTASTLGACHLSVASGLSGRSLGGPRADKVSVSKPYREKKIGTSNITTSTEHHSIGVQVVLAAYSQPEVPAVASAPQPAPAGSAAQSVVPAAAGSADQSRPINSSISKSLLR